ncbi:hypothetical protein ECE50_010645 [Chitinophaga sp. Mgbs1]|uniref:Fe2OG dioxygenase domain-containing protein n=1 Tax=Chitinophaga solisilvae TaxID=1233460 RepID=A0A9Q5GLD7_9BACT|nr:hypothetical protein [Chitinophaga solisilvae]
MHTILTEHDCSQAAGKALQFLQAGFHPATGWKDFWTPAGVSDAWVTAYTGSILAGIPCKEAQTLAFRAWSILECTQYHTGGWSYGHTVPMDADSTTWGLLLATRLGQQHSKRYQLALQALRPHINEQGVATYLHPAAIAGFMGIADYPHFEGWTQAHMCVTAATALLPPFREQLSGVLLNNQQPDGSWPAYWWFETAYTTALAVECLSADPSPQALTAVKRAGAMALQRLTDESGQLSPFSLALLLNIGLSAGLHSETVIRKGLQQLLQLQQENGCWKAGAWLRIPRPDDLVPDMTTPWQRWFGAAQPMHTTAEKLAGTFHIFSVDQHHYFTTATVLKTLQLYHPQQTHYTPVSSGIREDYPLSAANIAAFSRDGMIQLRQVFDRESIYHYKDRITALVAHAGQQEHSGRSSRDIRSFLRATDTGDTDKEIHAFIRQPVLAAIAARLLQTDAVRLYHDQAFFKLPGNNATPWHQDHTYWPVDTDQMLTIWIPLEDIAPDMGGMRYVAGSHQKGYLGDIDYLNNSPQALADFTDSNGLSVYSADNIPAGDVLIHHGWTIHGAAPNTSARTRKSLTIVYFADGARLAGITPATPSSDAEKQAAWLRDEDLRLRFPGCTYGDFAISLRTPLLYP